MYKEVKEREADVAVVEADLDNDGEPELVIENDYLKLVALMPKTKGAEKYATRFVWGGWLTDILFKPADANFVVGGFYPRGTVTYKPGIYGFPDEFEKRVVMEDTPAKRRHLKIGVGVLESELGGGGRWSPAKLAEPVPWKVAIEDVPIGLKHITFTQSFDSPDGFGYRLTKRLIVPERSASFRIEVSLANSGQKELDTDWYAHPFFSVAGYGGPAWQEIPYAVKAWIGDDLRTLIEREAHALPIMAEPGTVWGWLTPSEMGHETWCATGAWGPDIFLAMKWDYAHRQAKPQKDRFLRVRNWLYGNTYALEPFVKIAGLRPGETQSWSLDVFVGQGLKNISSIGNLGVLSVDTSDPARLAVSFAPAQPLKDLSIRVQAIDPRGRTVKKLSASVPSARPDLPATVSFIPPYSLQPLTLRTSVVQAGRVLTGSSDILWRVEQASRLLPSRTRTPAPPSVKVLVATSGAKEDRELLYVESALKWAGIAHDVCPANQLPEDLSAYKSLFVLALDAVPASTGEKIRRFVASGGGLFVVAPGPLSRTPAADILPVDILTEAGEPKTIRTDYWPPDVIQRSGEAFVEDVWKLRSHLVKAAAAPVAEVPANVAEVAVAEVASPPAADRPPAQTIPPSTAFPSGPTPTRASPSSTPSLPSPAPRSCSNSPSKTTPRSSSGNAAAASPPSWPPSSGANPRTGSSGAATPSITGSSSSRRCSGRAGPTEAHGAWGMAHGVMRHWGVGVMGSPADSTAYGFPLLRCCRTRILSRTDPGKDSSPTDVPRWSPDQSAVADQETDGERRSHRRRATFPTR